MPEKVPVYWRLETFDKVELYSKFLTAAELQVWNNFRFDLRRHSWLMGRFTAKSLISKVVGDETGLTDVEIMNHQSGAPQAILKAQALEGCLSISHSGNRAVAAYAPTGLPVGVDIEKISTRTDAFIRDYFTVAETGLVYVHKLQEDLVITLIWSAKEALLKALGLGLRADTRQIEVSNILTTPINLGASGWYKFEIMTALTEKPLHGFWRTADDYIITLVVEGQLYQTLRINEIG